MEIRYRVTQDVRDVDELVARTLISRHLADPVAVVVKDPAPVERKTKTRSNRRGRYQRRDLRATD